MKAMAILETYEWCNIWFEKTDDSITKRALLVGDSITNAYRPVVQQLLDGKINIDMLTTSKAIDNPSLNYEVNYMLQVNSFDYDIIHFNNGLHGWHLSASEYEEHLSNMIEFIKSQSKATIILALSTPITVAEDATKINEALNNKVILRNQAVLNVTKKYNLVIDDLYHPCYGKPEYRVPDGYHYNEIGIRAQAEIVAKVVLENIHI